MKSTEMMYTETYKILSKGNKASRMLENLYMLFTKVNLLVEMKDTRSTFVEHMKSIVPKLKI